MNKENAIKNKIKFLEKLHIFAKLFKQHHNKRRKRLSLDATIFRLQEIGIEETGYKFCKVFVCDGGHSGRYMVELSTGNIYGVKSWTQVNQRRMYGTLDTVEQFDWSEEQARPIPGTPAEKQFYAREATIRREYKKRGRKSKSEQLVEADVSIPEDTFASLPHIR